jgi:DNA-binding beta-propeller fold protein YncE
LSADGSWLYVADSEGSSIRKVPLSPGSREVGTVVGSDHLPDGTRLFAFGDRDGSKTEARLQHALEVVHHDNRLYVADTYNHKIKVVSKNGETRTLAGSGKPGKGDSPAEFHEPAGLAYARGKLYVADTNNHLIRTIDLATNKVETLTISDLTPPAKHAIAAAGGGAEP